MFKRFLSLALRFSQRALRFLSIALFSSALLLAGCSSSDKRNDKLVNEADIYNAAEEQLSQEQWEVAIKNLQKLEENFPFGAYAEQGQLELVYAYYNSDKHDEAIATANRFIRLHPQHRNVDYAYYMLGLSSYSKGKGMFERIIPADLTKRDPGDARESLANFNQLLNRFPDSPYAADAKKRMLYLRNLLARYEINVANYYFKRKAYVAALSRGRYVLENYPQTPAIPDALAVMVQGYHLLSMQDRADEALAVLKTNYPDFPAFKKNGEFDYDYANHNDDRNLFGMLTAGLFTKHDNIGFDTREKYDAEYQKAPRAQ